MARSGATVKNTSSVKRDSVRMRGYNGYGATDNKIPRFDSQVYSSVANGVFTCVFDSAANGNLITIVKACYARITITAGSPNDTSSHNWGLSLNSNQLTTGIGSITAAHVLTMAGASPSAVTRSGMTATWEGPLQPGDIVRVHTEGTAPQNDLGTNYIFTAEIL